VSARYERFLRTSCPVSDERQRGVRRKYEAAQQSVRRARFYRRTGEGDWVDRWETESEQTLRDLEASR
jgi:hypothetical protein